MQLDQLVLRMPDGLRVVITPPVLATMSNYRQARAADAEACGALLGRHLLDNRTVIVDEVTEPQPGDKRSRFGCCRSSAHHQIAVTRWRQSDRTCTYLGLWHTHPEPVPKPSGTDYADWRRASADGEFFGDWLLFIIVGTAEISAWAGNTRGEIHKMNQDSAGGSNVQQ